MGPKTTHSRYSWLFRNSYVYCADPWTVEPTEFWWFLAKSQIQCIIAVDTEVATIISTNGWAALSHEWSHTTNRNSPIACVWWFIVKFQIQCIIAVDTEVGTIISTNGWAALSHEWSHTTNRNSPIACVWWFIIKSQMQCIIAVDTEVGTLISTNGWAEFSHTSF